jgi:hypothetical protein
MERKKVVIFGPRYKRNDKGKILVDEKGNKIRHDDYELVKEHLDNVLLGEKVTIISGHAIGLDRIGEKWAIESGVPVKVKKPDYNQYGRWGAPKKRNSEMAVECDLGIGFWDGFSGGTSHMISELVRLKKPFIMFAVSPFTFQRQ